jgi:hypothetical protein
MDARRNSDESAEMRDSMNDSKKHLAQEREEIATRIANFRATQERFEREREEFFATAWQRIRAT